MSGVISLLSHSKVPRRPKGRVYVLGSESVEIDLPNKEIKCTHLDLTCDMRYPLLIPVEGTTLPRRKHFSSSIGGNNTDCMFWNSCTRGIVTTAPDCGGDQRIGDEVREIRLDMQFHIQEFQVWTMNYITYRGASVRVLVIRENNNKAAKAGYLSAAEFVDCAPDLSVVLDLPASGGTVQGRLYSAFHCSRNWANRSRFTFLYDSIHPLTPRAATSIYHPAIDSYGQRAVSDCTVAISLDIDRVLKYSGSEPDATTFRNQQLAQGRIHVYMIRSCPILNECSIHDISHVGPQSFAPLYVTGSSRFYYQDM